MSLRWWWPVGLAGAVLGVVVAVLLAGSDAVDHPTGTIAATLLIGWSFLGTGMFAWRRRPENRIGPLMAAVGLTWLVSMLSNASAPLAFSIGYLLGAVPLVFVVHLLLAYPTGRVRGSARTVLALAYLDVAIGSIALSLLQTSDRGLDNTTDNVFALASAPSAANAMDMAFTLVGVVLALAAGVLLTRRWRAAAGLQRRGLAPLMVTGAAFLLFLAVTLASDAFHREGSELGDAAGAVSSIILLAVPYAYLAGLLGSGWSRAAAVGAVVRGLNRPRAEQPLRDAIADALRDPGLEIVFKRRDRDAWVDGAGRRYELPPGRAATAIVREGETIGALVHREALTEDPELLRSVADAAALALDNLRLEAELRARVAELQESRANIIAFGMAERRRLERDLHDGAQQRLVALSLQVNLARAKLEDDPATAATLLDSARDELRHALDELRELARGIHPAILTDQGLGPAVTALAERSPVPVDVAELPADRLPSQVEAVAYFVVSEALANVVKYAHAGRATVRVARHDGQAVVEVADDGVGGADAGRGTGLRGLADRVAALDGQLQIQSPNGAGTLVRAELPCASS